jgi:tripartite-type tricarboxylate transporter receptor subunit TctC
MNESAVRKIYIAIILLTVLIAAALYIDSQKSFWSASVSESSKGMPASFFDGATIKLIVPNNPGGGYDDYARLILPYLEKYTGARLQLVNMPGSGGMRALSELIKSPADGLTIGLVNGSGIVTNQIAGTGDMGYRMDELSFLGRLANDLRVLTISTQSEFSSFNDILNAKQAVRIGATGYGGSTYVDAVISRRIFDLNVNVIHGFNNSASMRHTMLRGDIDGAWSSWGSVREEVASGRIRLVVQVGEERHPALPEVPAITEFIDRTADPLLSRNIISAWQAIHLVGRTLAAPPGMDTERLHFLREAFRQALQDPQLHTQAEESGRPIQYKSGQEIRDIIQNAQQIPADMQQVFADSMASEL